MKAILLLVSWIVTCYAFNEWAEFKDFHGKKYNNASEESRRKIIFNENKRKIAEHNARYDQGLETYFVSMNSFGDLEEHEFRLKLNYSLKNFHQQKLYYKTGKEDLPEEIDWREKGVVPPVRDQGQLGSASLLSALDSLESLTCIKTGHLVELSTQNLVDCCSSDLSALADTYFDCIHKMNGVDTEGGYPSSGQAGVCKFDPSQVGATDSGFIDVSSGDETALQSALANIGPVAVLIDASNWSFQFYSGGIYNEPNCSPSLIDHSALVVGYGSQSGIDFWIVKNSWGVSWGEGGYLRMHLMFFFLLIVPLLVSVNSDELETRWIDFKNTNSRAYNNESEDVLRMLLFNESFNLIQKHNDLYNSGIETYDLRVTSRADFKAGEHNGYIMKERPTSPFVFSYRNCQGIKIPQHFDWREKGAVSVVKNQKKCGSCYAFVTTSAIESQIFLQTGRRVLLSEQNIVDCSRMYGNNGCQGGLMTKSFRYIKDNDGLNYGKMYPYEERENRCRYEPNLIGARVSNWVEIPRDPYLLQCALVTIGPIAAAMNAKLKTFLLYSHGIYFDSRCNNETLDHGILIVGYGIERNIPYWIVKNSWGVDWGEDGYFKIAMKSDICGITKLLSYPIL